MGLQMMIVASIGVIPLSMLIRIFHVRMKAGKSLLSLRSIDTYLFKVYSLSYFLGAIYILIFRPGSKIIALTLQCFSLLFYVSGKVRQNCIRENGIILLDSIAKLIKWDEIKGFTFHNKKLFIKRNSDYISVDFLKKDVEAIQNIISEKINIDEKTRDIGLNNRK